MKTLVNYIINEVRTDIRTPWTKEQAIEFITVFLKSASVANDEGRKIAKYINEEDWKHARRWFNSLAAANKAKDLKEFYKTIYNMVFDAIESN